MKNKIIVIIPFLCILLFAGVFFRQTFFSGKLPVPTDTLVGMYHPWLDFIAKEYPSGIPYKNFLITDPIRQQIPWRKLAIDSIRKGNFNPWNPYAFSGTPLSTNIQSGFFYPFNVLFLFLPFPIAWTALIILQQILSGMFMYVFLKISNKLSSLASLFGASCFMFCGFSTVWLTWGTIGQTLLWLPLLLFLCDVLTTPSGLKKRICITTSLGVILTTQYFAGHSQVFFYSFLVFIAYVLYRLIISTPKDISRKYLWMSIGGSVLVFVFLTAIHWIPFFSQISESSRVLYGSLFKEEGFFIPLQNIVQFVVPDFFGNPATLNYWGIWNYGEFSGYIGIAGLMFVLYSIFSRKKHEVIFWFSITMIALLFAFPTTLSQLPYTLRIPFLSSLQPTRLLAIVDIGLSVLAAIGFDAWLRYSRKKYVMITIFITAIIISFVWYVVKINPYGIAKEQLDVTYRNILLPSVIFLLVSAVFSFCGVLDYFLKKRNQSVAVVGAVIFIGISFFDLSRFGWKFTPFTDPTLFFPKTQIISYLQVQKKPYRITALDDRIMPPNVSSYYGIESIAGYDPLYDRRYEIFIAAMERGEPNINPPYGFNRIITPKNIGSRLFQLFGVRYVISLSDVTDIRFNKVMQEGQTRLYEYLDALPRAYMVEKVVYEKDEKKIFETLYDPSFSIEKDAIVEEQMSLIPSKVSENEKVVITSYSDNQIHISIQANTSRFVVVGNLFHKGWNTYLDGKPVTLLRANYLFMGVIVPEGPHSLELKYE